MKYIQELPSCRYRVGTMRFVDASPWSFWILNLVLLTALNFYTTILQPSSDCHSTYMSHCSLFHVKSHHGISELCQDVFSVCSSKSLSLNFCHSQNAMSRMLKN